MSRPVYVQHGQVRLGPFATMSEAYEAAERWAKNLSDGIFITTGPIPLRDDEVRCERCGSELVDDDGASFPYCATCDWCPDCGVTHPASRHPNHVPKR